MSTTGLNPLVDKIRAAYPGTYNDLSDAELTSKILAKYPQYGDLAQPYSKTDAIKSQELNNPSSPNFAAPLPGSFEGSYSSGDTGKAAAMSAAGGLALSGLLAGQALAPSVVTRAVGTGLLDAVGNEITKDMTTAGPSLAARAAASTVGAVKAATGYGVPGALAYHLARNLGVPLPKILDVLDSFGGGQ